MPTYEYNCKFCGEELEEFQTIVAKPLVKCPACNRRGLVRQIGSGAGIIFKGSGFYQTDYKNNEGSNRESESDSKSDKKADKSKDSKDSKESKESKEKVATPPAKSEKQSKE
jgi:putative FmdB family regulatory protein